MRKTIFAVLILAAVALVGSPSGLTWSCGSGTSQSGTCAPGPVTFSGQQYPSTVHVRVVRNSTNDIYDDWDYDTTGGNLSFTETLRPADSYSVTVTGESLSLTQTVSTGVTEDR
jgi:hypothetical protein